MYLTESQMMILPNLRLRQSTECYDHDDNHDGKNLKWHHPHTDCGHVYKIYVLSTQTYYKTTSVKNHDSKDPAVQLSHLG